MSRDLLDFSLTLSPFLSVWSLLGIPSRGMIIWILNYDSRHCVSSRNRTIISRVSPTEKANSTEITDGKNVLAFSAAAMLMHDKIAIYLFIFPPTLPALSSLGKEK